MKRLWITLICLAFSLSSPLWAQKKALPKNPTVTANKMNVPATLKDELIEFLHESFPASREVPAKEMDRTVQRMLQKAIGYDLEGETDLATYVITSYVLGENFDIEIPEANKILWASGYTSQQKASLLETWMRQAVAALEENPELAQKVGAQQAAMQATQPSVADDLDMHEEAQPYRKVADWAVERLGNGDVTSVLKQFSPNFIQHLGMPKVEKVFQEQMLPFFKGNTIGKSATITQTHDAFGSDGFAFYLSLTEAAGEKPFILYIVKEDNHLVVANLVLNKTYADMHPGE